MPDIAGTGSANPLIIRANATTGTSECHGKLSAESSAPGASCRCAQFTPHQWMTRKCRECGHDQSDHATAPTDTDTDTRAKDTCDALSPFRGGHVSVSSWKPPTRLIDSMDLTSVSDDLYAALTDQPPVITHVTTGSFTMSATPPPARSPSRSPSAPPRKPPPQTPSPKLSVIGANPALYSPLPLSCVVTTDQPPGPAPSRADFAQLHALYTAQFKLREEFETQSSQYKALNGTVSRQCELLKLELDRLQREAAINAASALKWEQEQSDQSQHKLHALESQILALTQERDSYALQLQLLQQSKESLHTQSQSLQIQYLSLQHEHLSLQRKHSTNEKAAIQGNETVTQLREQLQEIEAREKHRDECHRLELTDCQRQLQNSQEEVARLSRVLQRTELLLCRERRDKMELEVSEEQFAMVKSESEALCNESMDDIMRATATVKFSTIASAGTDANTAAYESAAAAAVHQPTTPALPNLITPGQTPQLGASDEEKPVSPNDSHSLSPESSPVKVPPPVPHATRPQRPLSPTVLTRRAAEGESLPALSVLPSNAAPRVSSPALSPISPSALAIAQPKGIPPPLPVRKQTRRGSLQPVHQLPPVAKLTVESFLTHLHRHLRLPDAHLQFLSKFVEDILESQSSKECEHALLNLIDEVLQCEWRLEELIGHGGFGCVYRARRVNVSSVSGPALVAMKCIDLEASDEDVSTISHEVLSLASTRACPQLIEYYGCSVIHTSSLWLSMEYIDDGSLLAHIHNQGPLSEELIAIIAKEILLGLQYMAREGKIHRDIKPANVLVNAREGQIKLCDFGASKTLTDTMSKCNTLIGSPYYIAPEVLQQSAYDSKADVWSLGILLYECVVGQPPLAHIAPMQVMHRIVTSPSPSLTGVIGAGNSGQPFSATFLQFFGMCVLKDASLRPSVQMLLRHDFIRKAKKLATVKSLFWERGYQSPTRLH